MEDSINELLEDAIKTIDKNSNEPIYQMLINAETRLVKAQIRLVSEEKESDRLARLQKEYLGHITRYLEKAEIANEKGDKTTAQTFYHEALYKFIELVDKLFEPDK